MCGWYGVVVYRANKLNYGIALNLTSYLPKETAYVPWRAFLDSIDFIKGMLSTSNAYGRLNVTTSYTTGLMILLAIKIFSRRASTCFVVSICIHFHFYIYLSHMQYITVINMTNIWQSQSVVFTLWLVLHCEPMSACFIALTGHLSLVYYIHMVYSVWPLGLISCNKRNNALSSCRNISSTW